MLEGGGDLSCVDDSGKVSEDKLYLYKEWKWLVKGNPKITVDMIKTKLSIFKPTVEGDIVKLRKSNKVQYAGSVKERYWQVMNN